MNCSMMLVCIACFGLFVSPIQMAPRLFGSRRRCKQIFQQLFAGSAVNEGKSRRYESSLGQAANATNSQPIALLIIFHPGMIDAYPKLRKQRQEVTP
jgi:hypothetical protein